MKESKEQESKVFLYLLDGECINLSEMYFFKLYAGSTAADHILFQIDDFKDVFRFEKPYFIKIRKEKNDGILRIIPRSSVKEIQIESNDNA